MTVPGYLPISVNPTSPLLVVHLLGIVVALATAGYAARNRDYPGVAWFAAWSGFTAAWLAAHTTGLVIGNPGTRIVVQAVAFAITPPTALCWVAFAVTYTGRGGKLTPRLLRVLSGLAVVLSLFALTNPLHHLAVEELSVDPVAGVEAITAFAPNPGFWLVTAFVYPLFFVGLAFLVELVLSGRRLYADQGAALLLAASLPLGAAVLYLSGQLPVNLTPLASAVATLPVAYAVFRTQVLDLVPAFQRAGERSAVHALDDGVLVLDPADRVAVVNARAADILADDPDAIRRRPIGELLEDSPLEATSRWIEEATDRDGAVATERDGADATDRGSADATERDGADATDRGSADATAAARREGAASDRDPSAGDGAEPSHDARPGAAVVPSRLRDVRNGRIYAVAESRIEDDAAEDLGRSIVLQDVTEERRRKQRLLVLNRVVRHNLRNDMTVLLGHARMLASDDDDESLAVVEEIGSHLISLGEKAQEIDTIIRQSPDPERPVNVAGIVERICVRERRDHPEVDFDVRIPAQAWTESHGPVIEAIVSNLVENAVDHGASSATPGAAAAAGGASEALHGDGDGGAESPVVTVALERRSDRHELVVSDDGPGIPRQELESVLGGEISDLHHASGLGLWMVKWCVDLADAHWTIDTQSGTRVVVSFDRTDADGHADG